MRLLQEAMSSWFLIENYRELEGLLHTQLQKQKMGHEIWGDHWQIYVDQKQGEDTICQLC